jgi:hypothetical protein
LGPLAAGAGFLVANVLRLVWATAITPGIVGKRMPVSEVAQSTLPPLAAGLLVGWFVWPISAMSWLAVFANYVLIGIAVFMASLILSFPFSMPRSVMFRIYVSVRNKYSKR